MPNRVKENIRTVENWPKEGIMFRDVLPLLKNAEETEHMMNLLYDRYNHGKKIDYIVGIESRGFIFGAMLADRLKVGFVPIRKKGKLPPTVISEEYELEYGTDVIEIFEDEALKGAKVVVVDDLIATGGTCLAACSLLKKVGADVHECCFIIDLPNVGGRKKLEDEGYSVFALTEFEGD